MQPSRDRVLKDSDLCICFSSWKRSVRRFYCDNRNLPRGRGYTGEKVAEFMGVWVFDYDIDVCIHRSREINFFECNLHVYKSRLTINIHMYLCVLIMRE